MPLKVFVFYDSKYGNTKCVAEQIIEGLTGLDGVEAELANIKEIDLQKIADYDALIIGAPNHMGRPSRVALKFVDRLAKLEINAKWIVAFDTYFQRARNFEKSMKKMELYVERKLPKMKVIKPGLSIKVKGVKGPIVNGELPKAKDFGKRVGIELKNLQSSVQK
jgi:menaquinone-dependent protoporphyrinogen IX oxidase